jgi:hypothetical protein
LSSLERDPLPRAAVSLELGGSETSMEAAEDTRTVDVDAGEPRFLSTEKSVIR